MAVVPESFAGFGTADTANTVTSVSLPKPSGVVAGDFLLCFVGINYDAPADITAYAIGGFSQVVARNTPTGQYYPKTAIFSKIATGSEPANYTLTRPSGSGQGNLIATIVRFSGVDTNDPFANLPTLVSGPQASGSFGSHTPADDGYSIWYYGNQNYRANRDTTITWGGNPGAKIADQVNIYTFHSLFGVSAVAGGATGTRSITIGNWGGNTPSTVTPLVLREADTGPPPEPILVDVPPVDVAASPVAPEIDRLVDVDPVNIAVDQPAVAVEIIQHVQVDIDPVDIVASALTTTAAHTARVPVVDLTVDPTAAEPGRGFDVDPVDVVATPLAPRTHRGINVAPVDIATAPLAPKLAYAVDLGFVSIAHSHPAPDWARLVDLGPVDVTIAPRPVSSSSTSMAPIPVEVDVLPVTVAYTTDTTAAQRGIPIEVITHPARVMAQNIRTNEWLHLDLPIQDLELGRALSGAQVITGSFKGEVAELADLNLEPWATWIHVEQNDVIRGSGILQPTKLDTGQTLALEAVGVSAYPHGIPYLGPEYKGVKVDPADCLRLIWQHLQSYPDGDIGVEVVGTTPIRIGEEERDVSFETSEGEQVDFTAGPYKLAWYEGTDCGSEQDDLAKEGGFEFIEVEFWNDPVKKDFVRHQIRILYPRAGIRREDIVFAADENLIDAFGPEESADTYASHVVVFGKGEGTSKVRGTAGAIHPTRIRRVALIDKKTVDSTARAGATATDEWYRRQTERDITEITARAHHQNARIGSYELGDDVPVIGDVPYYGWINQYERILGWTWSPDVERVRIQTRRSDSFVYGGPDQ